MAKQRGRPKLESPRESRQVRIDPDVVAMAEMIAVRRGEKVGPWLSNLVAPHVRREYMALLRELKDLEEGAI